MRVTTKRYISTGLSGWMIAITLWVPFCALFIYYLLGDHSFEWYWVFIITLSIFLLATLTQLVVVKRVTTNEDDFISIQKLGKNIRIEGPFETKSCWTYDFEENVNQKDTRKEQSNSSAANTLHVWLQVKSADADLVDMRTLKNIVVFREEIRMSDRFPNEHPYEVNPILIKTPFVKVWNVDRLIRKLELSC